MQRFSKRKCILLVLLTAGLLLSTLFSVLNYAKKNVGYADSVLTATQGDLKMGGASIKLSQSGITYDSKFYQENISTPFWKSNIIYNEIVMPYSQTPTSGKIGYGQLLYTPVKVISVRDQTLNIEYTEGVDYVVEPTTRRILILEGSSIKCVDEGSTLAETAATSYPTNDTEKYPYRDNITDAMAVKGYTTLGPVTYTEHTVFLDHYLSVTYLYDTSELPLDVVGDNKETPFTAYIPTYMTGLRQKLESGTVTEINYLSIGDSISQGCSATGGNLGIAPNTPQYQVQICNEIQRIYGVKVNLYNLAIGGTTSYYPLNDKGNVILNNGTFDAGGGKTAFEEALAARNYDFCTIAYGMNDFGLMDATQFRSNIASILDKVMADSPECNTLLISSFPMNPIYSKVTGVQGRLGSNFYDAMSAIRVWYDPVNNPNAAAKYDGSGNPVYGPYSNGNVRVINMHAMGDYMMKYEYTDAHAIAAGSISYNNYVGGKKSYLELSSSNVNHPNDFIHRLYAMNIMSSIYDYPTYTFNHDEINADSRSGIKFRVLISETLYNTLYTNGVANKGVKTGILVVPSKFVSGELTKNTPKVGNKDLTELWVESNEQGYLETYVFLFNQPENEYDTLLSARAYYEIDGVTYYSTDTCERDLSRVALKIYNDSKTDSFVREGIKDYIDATLSIHVGANGNITVNNDVDENLNYIYTEGAKYYVNNYVTAGMLELTTKQIELNSVPNVKITCDNGVVLDKSSLVQNAQTGKTTFNVIGVAQEKPLKQVTKQELASTGGYQIDLNYEGLNTDKSRFVDTISFVNKNIENTLNTLMYYKGSVAIGAEFSLCSFKDAFIAGETYYIEFTVLSEGLNLPESSGDTLLCMLCMNSSGVQVGPHATFVPYNNLNGEGTITYVASFTAPENMCYPTIYITHTERPSFYLKSVRIMKYDKNSYYVQNGTLTVEAINGNVNVTNEYVNNPISKGHGLVGGYYHVKTVSSSGIILSNLTGKFVTGNTYSIVIKGYGTFDRDHLHFITRDASEKQIHGIPISQSGSVMLTEKVNGKVVDRGYFELTYYVSAGTAETTPKSLLLYQDAITSTALDAYIHSIEFNEMVDGRELISVTSPADTNYLSVDLTTQRMDISASTELNILYLKKLEDGTILTKGNRTTAVWRGTDAYAGTMLYLKAFNTNTLAANATYKLSIKSTFIVDVDKLALGQGNDSATTDLGVTMKVKKLGYYNGEMLYEYYVFFTPLTTANTYLKLVNTEQQAGECMPYTLYGITIENVASVNDSRKALTSVEESVITSELGYVSDFSNEKFVINDARATHVKTNGVTVNGYNVSKNTDSTWLLKIDFGTGGGILPLNQFDNAIKENMAAGADVAYTLTISCYTTINAPEFYLLQCLSTGGQSPTHSKWSGSTGVNAYYIHQDENDNGKMLITFAFDPSQDFDHIGLWLNTASSNFTLYIDEITFKGLKMVDNPLDTSVTKIVYPNVYDAYGFFANAQSVLILDKGKVVLFDGGEIDMHGSLKKSWYTQFVIEYTLRYYGVTTIDAMILSHPHSDHLGYLIPAMQKFTVKNFYYKWFSNNPLTGETADGYKNGTTHVNYAKANNGAVHPDGGVGMNNDIQKLLADCDTYGVPKHMVTFGQVVTLNNDANYKSQLTFYFDQMIYGPKNGEVNENTYSLTCMYTVNGRNVMYLSGDNMDNEQHFIDAYGWTAEEAKKGPGAIIDAVDNCIIYQLSHHGDTGAYNSLRLIEKLDAEWGIVCAPDYEKFRFAYNRPCLDLVDRLVGNGMARDKIVAPLGDGIVFNVKTGGNLVIVEKVGK